MMLRPALLFLVLASAAALPARADQAASLLQSRQCFPAALLLARDAATSSDPQALDRFCAVVTGSCDGQERRFVVPDGAMAAGSAWQECVRRAGDAADRLATLPAGETCEERAELAAVATLAGERARAAFTRAASPAAEIEAVRTSLLSVPPLLNDDPCPPATPEAPATALMPEGQTPEERLVSSVLSMEIGGDPAPLEMFQATAIREGWSGLAAVAAARRAELLEKAGHAAPALHAAGTAILLAAEADAALAEERALSVQARVLDQLGSDRPAAIDAYAAALRSLDRRRPELLVYDWIRQGSPYRLQVEPLADRYVALQLDEAAGRPAAERQAIYRDVLRLADRARAAELSDYFQDDCVADLQARTRSVGEIDPQAAALVAIVLGRKAELFLMLPDGTIRHERASLPPRAELEAYPSQLIDPAQPDGWKATARTLYDILIRPFAADLARSGVDSLVFVPDGPLRHVLPATLMDGDTMLIERYAVALNPGLDFIDDAPVRSADADWLLAAVSKACPPRWAALEGTRQEVSAIAALRPSTSTLTLVDDEFARTGVFQDLATRPLSIVHFATHAEFAPQASDSKVLLGTCEELGLDDLERLIKQARYRDRPVQLLVLSACQSALGDDRAALGLAGLAVKSGARAAIGSMWKVDDAAAARLMTLFHQELAKGDVGKAEALRQAQLTLAKEPGMAAPMYWAAFQLVGDWR